MSIKEGSSCLKPPIMPTGCVTDQCFIFSDEDVLQNFSTLKLHKTAHKTLTKRIMFLWLSTLNKGLWRFLDNLRPDFKLLKVIAQNRP